MEEAREDDPELAELRELLDAWANEFGTVGSFTTAEIISMIGERFDDDGSGGPPVYKFSRMREIVLRFGAGRTGIDARRVANAIRAKEGRIVLKMKLTKAGAGHGGAVRWNVRMVG